MLRLRCVDELFIDDDVLSSTSTGLPTRETFLSSKAFGFVIMMGDGRRFSTLGDKCRGCEWYTSSCFCSCSFDDDLRSERRRAASAETGIADLEVQPPMLLRMVGRGVFEVMNGWARAGRNGRFFFLRGNSNVCAI
jgi:hypothetical protein